MTQRRVVFDFEVAFSNGGGIQGQGFRLDIYGPEIEDEALARYIVDDMRLLMVREVRILNKRIIRERHKRKEHAPSGQTKELVDLSHTVRHGLQTYPGLPSPVITDYLSRSDSRAHYATGTEFQIGSICMVGNTGTYLDSPFHRYPDGADLSRLDLTGLADIEGVVVRAPSRRRITEAAFSALDVRDKAVLVHTGWDRHWDTEQYARDHPFLTEGAARHLAEAGAVVVGIDSLNIDDTDDGRRPAHTTLLGAGIPIVEHMCHLDRVPDGGFRFFAVPVKVEGFGTFPIRCFASIVPQLGVGHAR